MILKESERNKQLERNKKVVRGFFENEGVTRIYSKPSKKLILLLYTLAWLALYAFVGALFATIILIVVDVVTFLKSVWSVEKETTEVKKLFIPDEEEAKLVNLLREKGELLKTSEEAMKIYFDQFIRQSFDRGEQFNKLADLKETLGNIKEIIDDLGFGILSIKEQCMVRGADHYIGIMEGKQPAFANSYKQVDLEASDVVSLQLTRKFT